MQQGSLLSIPPHYVYVPRETLGKGDGYEKGIWHAITIEHNRYIKAHVLFEAGFHYSDIQLHSLWQASLSKSRHFATEELQPYECLSYLAEVQVIKLLENVTVKAKTKDAHGSTFYTAGTYLFSVHFLGRETWMNLPEQRKILHCIKLDSGQFAFLPNNHLLWCDEAVTSADPQWPDWLKANEHE